MTNARDRTMEPYGKWLLPASSSDISMSEPMSEPSSRGLTSTTPVCKQLMSCGLASRSQNPPTTAASCIPNGNRYHQIPSSTLASGASPTPIALQSWKQTRALASFSSIAPWRNKANTASLAERAESCNVDTPFSSAQKQNDDFFITSCLTTPHEVVVETVMTNGEESSFKNDHVTHKSSEDESNTTQSLVTEGATNGSATDVSKKLSVFEPDELRQALMLTWDWVHRQEPESLPFREPVDPRIAPDYYTKIKKPMDLSLVRHRLDSGHYTDPWDYVQDMWQIFENAWFYNRKTTRCYKYATKTANYSVSSDGLYFMSEVN